MIKIPLPQIIEKIKEKANLTDADINTKIEEKLKQLSGLISKEGAAHIIANELGVKLFEEVSGKLQIKNILVGMRDVETVGKVQRIFPVNEFQRQDGSTGKVCSLVLADETGSIRIVLWGSQTDLVGDLKEGTVAKVVSGYVRENNNRMEVHLNEKSKLIVNPEGESLGEVKQYSSTRKKIQDLKEQDNDVELLGTVVQVFEPRFFEVCPQCNKRVRQREENFVCEQHKIVTPAFSYVLNAVLDDGSETIRAVFFRKQAENLLSMSQEQVLQYKDSPEKFDETKNNLLGNIIKIIGRVNKNEMFDRLEFVTRLVFPNPDPKQELEKLKETQEAKPEQPAEKEPPEVKKTEEVKQEEKVEIKEPEEGSSKLPTVEEI